MLSVSTQFVKVLGMLSGSTRFAKVLGKLSVSTQFAKVFGMLSGSTQFAKAPFMIYKDEILEKTISITIQVVKEPMAIDFHEFIWRLDVK